MGIDLTINDRQAIENNYVNSLVCDYEIVWNIWKFIFYKTKVQIDRKKYLFEIDAIIEIIKTIIKNFILNNI